MPKATTKQPTLQLEGLSKTKTNLRSAKRFLSRGGISDADRLHTEQKVRDLEAQLESTKNKNAETKNEARYKGVRFVETKKIKRKIKQIQKEIGEDTANAELAEKLLHARVDLHYTLNFPLDTKYIALFPEGEYVEFSSADLNAEDITTKQRQTIRQKILDDMKAGIMTAEPESLQPKKKAKVVKPAKKAQPAQEEEEEQKQVSEAEEADDFFE